MAYRRYHLALRQPLRTAHGRWTHREGVWLRLERADGAAGYGEAAPIPWFGTETADDIEAACAALGRETTDEQLDVVPARLGCLRQALTNARGRGPAVTVKSAWPAAGLLPAGRPALQEMEAKAEAGFRVFKWKVGAGPAADELALLDDVCAGLPDGGRLRLDANGAWDRRTAERWLERCAERPVEFVEQPAFAQPAAGAALLRQVEDLLMGLARDYPTPLALDEAAAGEGSVRRWLERGWPGIYVIKPALLGEPAAVLSALAAAGARVVFSSALETAIGARASLTWAFSWPGQRLALGFGVGPLFERAELNGPAAAPFVYWDAVEAINPEAVWNAGS